ncbi:thioredoxin domain-containing protein [Adhaeribacter pallidiroseus]|uniref:Spermatoproteinis-associated protein n=1 Tax=Adhaeribacter pallidiroseus TaxID=2072847 RepID=A0A369QEC3_9BACT|nr:thioredoxin domain-containing protein [Adhaeribacter pallidiroseus]RDC61546.1 Spermatoproteinis-associated protein [Adhaeribacter pallidiroseus]
MKKANRLLHESSPYLLQHAYNPVDWYPWGEEALQKARSEQKPIIVSIGYAACHWCHVMEHQSFEHEGIAQLMNEHFVCIKVDREERPDVDQIYMDAVHAMGLQGGWPLNVFLNPEAKPFYGGTYFPPQNWSQMLQNIAKAYRENREELDQSAEQFAEHLNTSDLKKYGIQQVNSEFTDQDFRLIYHNLSLRFEKERGGMGQAPKFPMPVNYLFLLRYHQYSNQTTALEHVNVTLREMAFGGIYDQAGGGFARYSTDSEWLVPHFEKMLYDNGQLVSLYAEAYQVTKNPLYQEVVYETIAFVERELMSPEGGFYSSLDADSEGEEGKFYVFTKEELQEIIGTEEPLFSAYYNIRAEGNWEHNQNILHRRQTDEAFAAEHQLEVLVLKELIKGWKEKVMQARAKRVRPGLDDKILTSWNALMLKGLSDAYHVFQEERFLKLALQNASFLRQNLKNGPKLFRNYKNGKATIDAFLEDYALLIQAFLRLYEVTFDEIWLNEAHQLAKYTLSNFFDEKENLFFYTDKEGEQLIARKKEIMDNVIPASNSVMALNLLFLALHFDRPKYADISDAMLSQVKELLVKQPSHLANWATVYYYKLKPTAEIAIVGPEAQAVRQSFADFYLPNAIFTGTKTESTLPLLTDRFAIGEETTIYICYNKTCQLPVHTLSEALEQLDSIS